LSFIIYSLGEWLWKPEEARLHSMDFVFANALKALITRHTAAEGQRGSVRPMCERVSAGRGGQRERERERAKEREVEVAKPLPRGGERPTRICPEEPYRVLETSPLHQHKKRRKVP